MADRNDVPRYRKNLQGEREGIAVYRAMAEEERNPQLAEVYRKLAAVEEKHARFWEEKIRSAGGGVEPWRLTLKGRLLRWFAHRFGPRAVLPLS